MARVIEVADGFINLRGPFRVRGILEIGTHASLVRLESGKHVLLDTLPMDADARQAIDERTDGGKQLEAIINLHPFHTVFVQSFAEAYPDAKLYGSVRHHEKLSGLSWQPEKVEDPAFWERYKSDFEFTVPRGVDYISPDPNLHFSSVLAFHRASKTLHVDDTLLYLRPPPPIRWFIDDAVRYHPTFAKVLQKRAGAAAEFRAWADELVQLGEQTENLCAAHSATLLGRKNAGSSIADRIRYAGEKIEKKLARHERAYG